jgi:hypothetical protein
MKAMATERPIPSPSANTGACNQMVAGYAAATVGLLLDLATRGASGTPAWVGVGTAGLYGIGILVTAAGLAELRAGVDPKRRGARRGLALQALGLLGLLLGVLALKIADSIPMVLFVSAAFVVSSTGLALAGAFLMKNNRSDIGSASRSDAGFLLLGTALIFTGVLVILAVQIGYYFVFADVATTVLQDAGVAVAACGCVVAAYASWGYRDDQAPQLKRPTAIGR